MKHLSWRREDIRSDLNKLPLVWKVVLGVAVIFATMFGTYVTEVFQLVRNSWTYIVVSAVYALALFVALRLLRLKLTN